MPDSVKQGLAYLECPKYCKSYYIPFFIFELFGATNFENTIQ